MSTNTDQSTDDGALADRSLLDRLRSSQFLSNLLSNRLAIIGLTIILGMLAVAIIARVSYDLSALRASNLGTVGDRLAPGWAGSGGATQHLFGTDAAGRDIFKRTLYGAWIAIKYGTVTVAASTFLGVALGIIAAYYSDLTDNVIMRTMDVLLAFPSLLLALALVAIFGAGLWKVVIALTLVYTPRFARVVRGAALKVLEDEYIEATEALGATDARVLARHVFPNTLAPVTVQSTLNYGLAIIDFAALSFLGFGAAPGVPSWGLMLSNGVTNGLLTGKWWMSLFPGLFLAILVLGFNLLGDGMRDALDPRMREAVD
ncbi:ABC transporter permease [Halobacterium salinarum]|uniref:ABC-type transport system permease protein (Probable substrate dipeptide/oligopeptide) n=1 Tax=Halobacterium salinarum (strain ATCC 33171 / DSM 3754 / JCM 8978 / NBRC 102687 / NCIMB 764 / 91-R6) TaxID=2597657 RepID=A0A4D6GRS3_HALS9|nr:ABC transporter permease [Halobacterium salinarum]MDL0121962.1 ABC transporter permease [Halobacterium salinarum]MDL0132328.1 ABC transporter permease [Halobacterium salinarum]QCC43846.1 ABC-type transport system permease protein (probable substrate dipeptide/oligopeptide) [Halobacterium salinarum]TYO82341.1 peptide/nickel transport system permease protein [Halobacterium salinarum DSM 3754]